MSAYATQKVKTNLDLAQIKELTKSLHEEFCLRHPEIKGQRRDKVHEMYFYSLKFGKYSIPTDSVILNCLENNTFPTAATFEYNWLEMNQDGTVTVGWKPTKEPMVNIPLNDFKTIGDFRSKFIGSVNDDTLRKYWDAEKQQEFIVYQVRKRFDKEPVAKEPKKRIQVSKKSPILTTELEKNKN